MIELQTYGGQRGSDVKPSLNTVNDLLIPYDVLNEP